MQSLKTFLLFLLFSKANNFLIPSSLLGKWKTTKNEKNVFYVNENSIFALHNEGNISMSVLKINHYNISHDISIDMNNLCIHKIPKNIDYKNMIQALRIINLLKKKGLNIKIYDTLHQNVKEIKFESGDINGNFQIIRCID